MSPAYQAFISCLETADLRPRVAAGGHSARWPAHDDRVASLTVHEGRDGRVLVHCQAGCSWQSILQALGREAQSLFADPPRAAPRAPATAAKATPDVVSALPWHEVQRWVHCGPDGRQWAHVRLENGAGDKRFSWEPTGVKTPELPLYNHEQLASSNGDLVVYVEGERKADVLKGISGLVPVATVTGASGIPSEQSLAVLRDRLVFLWPDNDAPGLGHVEKVGRALRGVAKAIAVVPPWEGAPAKGDAVDFVVAFGLDAVPSLIDKTAVEFGIWSDARIAGSRSIHPISDAVLAETEVAPIESYLAEASLPRGHVAMLHGKGGVGKSYLAIGLGLAIANGVSWLSLTTRKGRVLMLSYEIPAAVFKSQCGEWRQHLDIPPSDDFLAVSMEQLTVRLLESLPGEAEDLPWRYLEALIRKTQANVLILDPFRSFHYQPEEDSTEMSRLMDGLRSTASVTSTGLMVLHHDRKGAPGKDDQSSDAARGSSAIRDSVRAAMRLYEAKGKLCLEFHKSNLGSAPAPVWLDPQEHAPPQVCEAPETESRQQKKGRKSSLEAFMRAHPEGVTIEMVKDHLDISTKTAKRYLAELTTVNLRPFGDTGTYVLKGVGQ